MEIVLLWLDDLDDLVAAGLFKRTLLRFICLIAALGAAVTAAALLRLGVQSTAALALLNASPACLAAWALFGPLPAFVSARGPRSRLKA